MCRNKCEYNELCGYDKNSKIERFYYRGGHYFERRAVQLHFKIGSGFYIVSCFRHQSYQSLQQASYCVGSRCDDSDRDI